MSKRSNPPPDGQQSRDDNPAKRQQTLDLRISPKNPIDALLILSENSDDLISCLQSLKRQEATLRNLSTKEELPKDLLAKLSLLSRKLAPQFQFLATISDLESDSTKNTRKNDVASYNLPVISPSQVKPWSSSDIPTTLPPLPPVNDPEVAKTAFTHPGLNQSTNYERLEWIGDAYLELISTILISQVFSKLPNGRVVQIRERLIRNTTLAEYFRKYGLQSQARLPPQILAGNTAGRGRSNDKDLIKTQADMFEAYTAAAIVTDPINGLQAVTSWLRDLWSMTIEEDIRKLDGKPSSSSTSSSKTESLAASQTEDAPSAKKSLSPKEELAAMIVVRGLHLRYEKLPCSKKDKHLNLPLFAVGAYFDGWGDENRLLAVGTALSVKEAGQKAAAEAMQNHKLMNVYKGKKRAFLEARDAAAAEKAAIATVDTIEE